MYDCYFTNVLTQRSRFEVFLTADSQCFTHDNARTFVLTIPRRRRAFTVSWNIEVVVHSNSASSVVIVNSLLSGSFLINSSLSAPTKIEELKKN